MPKLPWGRKQGEEVPKEIEEMTSEQLLEAINKSKEVDKLKTDLAAATAKASEVDEVRSQLRSLEQRVNTPPKDQRRAEEQPTKFTEFLDDEDKAFDERFTARLQPFAQQTLMAQGASAKFQARASLKGLDGNIWDKWEDEIVDVMKTVDLNWQAVPQTWINALNTVAGRHRNDLLKMKDDSTEFFSETASNGGRGGPPEDQSVHLSPEQERVAKRLGVKPEDALKYMKEANIRG